MNRRKLNVLQTILVGKKFQKNFKSESNFFEIITNDEYYRVKNNDELRQILKKTTSNKIFVNTKEVNKNI